MTIWKIRGKIIGTVMCSAVYNCAQSYAPPYEREQLIQSILV